MILEFPHLRFGVPRFPWAGEVAEVEGGWQGGGTSGAGRPSCLWQQGCGLRGQIDPIWSPSCCHGV